MFDSLQDRFGRVLKNVRGMGRLTESNIKDTMREVRMALLEADVALPVAREFIAAVREKALGEEVVGSLTPGQALTVFDADGSRVSVAICYEAVYASMAQAFVAQGSELLATITNDAWFNRSSAASQHFEQAALRAVEQGRYLVRAANTGISGAVDPYGRVIARTPLFDTTMLAVDVRLLDGHTIYHRLGDLVAWLSLVVAATTAWLTRRQRTV